MASVVNDMLLLVNVRTTEVVMEAPNMVNILADIRYNSSQMIDKYQAKINVPPTCPQCGVTPLRLRKSGKLT